MPELSVERQATTDQRRPSSRSSDSFAHLPSLDGVRAVAVLLVFFQHVPGLPSVPGGLGVTLFFVLSGFLIASITLHDLDNGTFSVSRFFKKRFLRIVPPMLAVVGLSAIVLANGWVAVDWTPQGVASNLLFFTNYQYAIVGGGILPGTQPFWSLAVEEHFYLIFPLFALVLAYRRGAALWIVGILCGLCLAWRIALWTQTNVGVIYMQYATDTRFDCIFAGVGLAIVWSRAQSLSARVVRALGVGSLCVLAATVAARDPSFRETFRYSIQMVSIACLYVWLVRFPKDPGVRWLGIPALQWLGRRSYFFYLVHLLVIQVLVSQAWKGVPEGLLSKSALVAAALAISLLLSELGYRLVEAPLARLRSR